jgi:hypothetical protein
MPLAIRCALYQNTTDYALELGNVKSTGEPKTD